MTEPRNPFPTVDVIVETGRGVVLVERGNPPRGWALPGGFIDYGETAEDAAVREVREETGLDVRLTELLGVYSDPERDPRQHNLSIVYIGRAEGPPVGGDDARLAAVFPLERLPPELCFDHGRILEDYRRYRASGLRPHPDPNAPRALSPKERACALSVARDGLESAVLGRPPRPVPGEEAGIFRVPGACFVTLLGPDGGLRGCIGTLDAQRPLGEELRDMARASALRDPRFTPVSREELSSLRVSLSILSAHEGVADPEHVVVGRHGLSVHRHGQRGVLLPQVAVDHGWDRSTYLAQTCVKAGLPPEAWRDPDTEIYVFTTQIVDE